MTSLRRALFGISKTAVSFELRGFRGANEPAARHLETVAGTFVDGYNAALEEPALGRLAERLDAETPPERWGFAYEGAAMSLTLLDWALPWSAGRSNAFLAGAAAKHVYLAYVGLGWALARWPLGRRARFARFDPMMRWLALDGYGFHEAFFHTRKTVEQGRTPRWLATGYHQRAFDQGVGRCLWFVETASPERIAETIARFPAGRRADLWAGVGLACAYAGGVPKERLERLRTLAEGFTAELAQGVTFACKARILAGNPTPGLELAAQLICARSAVAAAELSDECGADLPPDGEVPAYEVWRLRVQRTFPRPQGAEAWTTPAASWAATR